MMMKNPNIGGNGRSVRSRIFTPVRILQLGFLLWLAMLVVLFGRLPPPAAAPNQQGVGLVVVSRDEILGGIATPQQQNHYLRMKQHSISSHNIQVDFDHPPPFYSGNQNEPYILHSLFTRFMVGQPNQPTLARARYKLFETFCFPTVQQQSFQNFYWIVLADPRLDTVVLADMKSLLQTMPNAYLILTTNTTWAADGLGVPNVTSYGIDIVHIATDYERNKQSPTTSVPFEIKTGNITRLSQLYWDLRQSNPVDRVIVKIETLLDADDGLHNQAMEWLQQKAYNVFSQQQSQSLSLTLGSTWRILCATNHIEWHNRQVFLLSPKDYRQFGISSGLTGLRQLPTFCPSAGFTRLGMTTTATKNAKALLPILHFPKQAYVNHATVMLEENHINYCSSDASVHCWKREFPTVALVMKTRTITSDSMDHLNPQQDAADYRDVEWKEDTPDRHPLWINETERTWEMLQTQFSIRRYQAWQTSVYLYEHAEEIVHENQKSRCIPGFPCREVTEENFKKLSNHFYNRERAERKETTRKKRHHH